MKKCFACLLVVLVYSHGFADALSASFGISQRPSEVSFRIIFGTKDSTENAWDGHIVPVPGQYFQLEPDHFRDYQYEKKDWKQGIIDIKLPDPKLPNDYMPDSVSWVVSTRYAPLHGPTTEWHDYGVFGSLYGSKVLKPVIVQPSILIHLKCNDLNELVHISTIQGEFSFSPAKILYDRSQYFLHDDVRVELVPVTHAIAPERVGQQDFPSILTARSGSVWTVWQEYNGKFDRLVVRRKRGNTWGAVQVLQDSGMIFNSTLAEDKFHHIWVVWSMEKLCRWDLYARYYDGEKWSGTERLTDSKATKNFYHSMVSDNDGNIWLVWQSTYLGNSQIYAKEFDGRQWSEEEQISSGKSATGDNWWPVVATGPDRSVAIAWDGYASGNYDIYLKRRKDGGTWGPEEVIARTPRFEAHPTLAIDSRSRVWIAWDESGVNWGKDVGFLCGMKGTPLHHSRSIGIMCLDGDKRLSTNEKIEQVLKPGTFWELPHLQIDGRDRPWLFVRHLVMREPDTPLEGPINLALWDIWATYYDGVHWISPVYLPHSTGRNEMMPASGLAPDGNVWVDWATDGRDTKDYQPQQQEVYLAKMDSVSSLHVLSMNDFKQDTVGSFMPIDPNESEQVKRIRNYRIQFRGKTYSIYRGDLHRHTDISVDGNNDGSLLDAYRYARDAASLDFIGIANHTDDIWDTYNWWRSQKVADLFNVNSSFVAFYGYERSIEWPNGHRNIFFTKKGAPILPIGAFEARAGYAGSGTLYGYVRRYNGISIPHTTGRTSGTDWRDNDPRVENIVEIYQGMRDSYEYPGSPRPFKLFDLPDSTHPVPRASSAPSSPSFKPLGFVSYALAKGYKLGFIASSDHISTHVSYACVIAPNLSRESLMDALRKRRTYAATDNIILDIKYKGSDGDHLMGDVFASNVPLEIQARIIGTDSILQVDVLKDNLIVKTYKPDTGSIFSFNYRDLGYQQKKDSYYYVRVIQSNGEMAWASPVWVTYRHE